MKRNILPALVFPTESSCLVARFGWFIVRVRCAFQRFVTPEGKINFLQLPWGLLLASACLSYPATMARLEMDHASASGMLRLDFGAVQALVKSERTLNGHCHQDIKKLGNAWGPKLESVWLLDKFFHVEAWLHWLCM